jgi:hypothetical protein
MANRAANQAKRFWFFPAKKNRFLPFSKIWHTAVCPQRVPDQAPACDRAVTPAPLTHLLIGKRGKQVAFVVLAGPVIAEICRGQLVEFGPRLFQGRK